MSDQTKISISKAEWSMAKENAKKAGFNTPTAYVRFLIRKNCQGA